MVILVLLATCGCSQLPRWMGGKPVGNAHEVAPSEAGGARNGFEAVSPKPSGLAAAPVNILAMQFDILRVDIPSGATKDAAKVWNHVDEMRIDPRQAPLLVRNGLRVGTTGQGAWPALRAIFDAARAQAREQQQSVRGGEPIVVELGAIDKEQTVFSYDHGGRLSGRTIPAGEMLLKLGYTAYPQVSGRMELIASFEIRHDRGVMEWENRGGQIVQTPSYDVLAFDDLTTMVGLGTGETLVIGPSEEAGGAFLPGSRFFTGVQRGARYETVWFITPRPYEMKLSNLKPR